MTLRLALADDQALVRSGLSALLQSQGFNVAISAADGAQLLDLLGRESVDVILSDIRMPGQDGFAVADALRRRGDATPLILLTTFDESDLLPRAVAAGAHGFLLKDASPDELREAIHRAHAKEQWLAPVATDPVRDRYTYMDSTSPSQRFGEPELAILRLLAGGYSNKEIARTLFLAEGTVKNYVSEILDKLGTRDRTRAVLKAITLRIV
jgi:DNA-binding NarL/FixJ family response regulator